MANGELVHLVHDSFGDPITAELGVWLGQICEPVLVLVPGDPPAPNIALADVYDPIVGETSDQVIYGGAVIGLAGPI